MKLITKLIEKLKAIELPLLTQEMRIRMRGGKLLLVMLIYVLLLIAVGVIIVIFDPPRGQGMSAFGQELFGFISLLQLAMVVVIVPAYSSASISSERERGTFDLLVLTKLSSSSIVRQKLVAAIGQVFLLILASLPVVGVCFVIGGVSPMEIVVVYAILSFTAILLSALGMLCSCCVRNSRTSTFLAYLVPIAAYALVPMCMAWMESIQHSGMSGASADSPVVFAIMFLITGAIPALALYGLAAFILDGRSKLWQERAFRMAICGGAYALLLVLMSTPKLLDMMLGNSDFSLMTVLNPFMALVRYVESKDPSAYSGSGYSVWMAPLTLITFAGATYLLERISVMKLNALRRI